VVVRCWRETNNPDPACPQTVVNALAAGFQVRALEFSSVPLWLRNAVCGQKLILAWVSGAGGRVFLPSLPQSSRAAVRDVRSVRKQQLDQVRAALA
jgi:hypothetical protein